ncbi:MAG: hypothetical protein M3081_00160 [Gemmatimonadota bacterium]|nr:hypothetical protein [Gemmatimonadota bacterium]
MRRYRSLAALPMVLAAIMAAGCQRKVVSAPSPMATSWDHCWWTVMQSALPLDTVAARFERGFTVVGMTGVTVARSGDTAWVHAGPTPLGDYPMGSPWQMRAVAYRHGDSTRFRYFVGSDQQARASDPPTDSSETTSQRIGLCTAVSKATAIRWLAPREPNGEETLAVWRVR